MDDYGAFRVISGIDADLYILRGISQLEIGRAHV